MVAMGDYLQSLGSNLRRARKRHYPRDDLASFALRVGVSRSTLQKMEQGDLSVSIGRYWRAAEILDLTETFATLFVAEESLFDDPP